MNILISDDHIYYLVTGYQGNIKLSAKNIILET